MKKFLAMILFVIMLLFCGCSPNTNDTSSIEENSSKNTISNPVFSTSSAATQTQTSSIESKIETPAKNEVVVPSVLGMTAKNAEATLQKAGLKMEVIYVDNSEQQDFVFSQDPSSNVSQEKGTAVKVLCYRLGCTFSYSTNTDGTICLERVISRYDDGKIIVIPKEYHGKKVNSVRSNVISSLGTLIGVGIKTRVPKNISIVDDKGNTEDPVYIERY